MYKATIEIAKITSMMKIKFGLIVESDEDKKYINQNNKLINKFIIDGNKYIKINPHPFIVIDISSTIKNEGWNSNLSVSLNRLTLYKFIQSLKKIIISFSNYKNLFYYNNEKLVVNQSLINEVSINISTSNSKMIRLQPCVVPDEENQEIVYEGCMFLINNMQNFAYLTYDEMKYLLWELEKIDMTSLSLELINVVRLTVDDKVNKLKIPPSSEKPVEIEKVSPNSITFIRSEMPKI